MAPEYHEIAYLHDVRATPHVFVTDVSQDLQLHQRLLVEVILVLDDLQCHQRLALVVIDLDDLAESATTDRIQQLVAVGNVIVEHVFVFVVLVVELSAAICSDLVGLVPNEVDMLELQHLLSLVAGQVLRVLAQNLGRC